MRTRAMKCFQPFQNGHHCHYLHNLQEIRVALDESRYFYNPETETCEKFIYGIYLKLFV